MLLRGKEYNITILRMIKTYVNWWFRLWVQVIWVKRKDLSFVLNVEYIEQGKVICRALKMLSRL